MAKIDERVAVIESNLGIVKWIIGIFVPLVVLWAAYITTSVIALKQAVSDGGNIKLVAQLKAPASPQQLRATLSTVTGQLQTIQVSHAKPNPQKISGLSEAISTVIDREPNLPEAWMAASAIVNLKPVKFDPAQLPPEITKVVDPQILENAVINQVPIRNQETPCLSLHSDPINPHTTGNGLFYFFYGCTLDLGDIEGFNSLIKNMRRAVPDVQIEFYLVRVNVIYRGGDLIPLSRLGLYGCTLDFNILSEPPSRGRALVQALLADPLTAHQKISLPS
jgi:hypothetical protein